MTSEALPFEYIPLDSGRHRLWDLQKSLKRKPDELDIFQELLTQCNQLTTNDLNDNVGTPLRINLDQNRNEFERVEVNNYNGVQEIDKLLQEKVRELENENQLNSLQEVVNIMQEDNNEMNTCLNTVKDTTNNIDKITEWMKSNEFDKTNEVNNLDIQIAEKLDEDQSSLNELLEQVAELDEIYSSKSQLPMPMQESFDDAATYTSLQIAFKHPIELPQLEGLCTPIALNLENPTVCQETTTFINGVPPRPPAPTRINITPTNIQLQNTEEEKAPPLPPKRLRKQDSDAENRSIEANIDPVGAGLTNTVVPIIIVKSPQHSPSMKRLTTKSESANILPKAKKSGSGFFSKLFSRRKSKTEGGHKSIINQNEITNASYNCSMNTLPFTESNRNSMRSVKSLQCNMQHFSNAADNLLSTTSKSPVNNKLGKPIARSVSSVSSKRSGLDVVHIPLKSGGLEVGNVGSTNSLPQNEGYSQASTLTLGNTLDRRTASALQLADIPISDGNMELVAITDRQSLRNLCEGEYNVQLHPSVDLTEAEHYALYTCIPPQATMSEFDETSAYYAPIEAGQILTPEEVTKRLAAANTRHY